MQSPRNALLLKSDSTEPFPLLQQPHKSSTKPSDFAHLVSPGSTQPRATSPSTSLAGRLRSASKRFEESRPPSGAWDAAGTIASSVPSLSDIRRGSYSSDGWTGEGQLQERERRASATRRSSAQSDDFHSPSTTSRIPRSPNQQQTVTASSRPHVLPSTAEKESSTFRKVHSMAYNVGGANHAPADGSSGASTTAREYESNDCNVESHVSQSKSKVDATYRTTPFDNGYEFPPQHTWSQATVIGLKAFWRFTCTWFGFLIVVYGLNVVAWGGMIFLLLCNAAPAMCKPTCDDINSPRRIWIEIDAQVLTALFSVTGFGLIPWRFRDLWYLMKYRFLEDEEALRRLAGIHRGWFRLAGSQDISIDIGPENVEVEASGFPSRALPYPLKCTPDAPLTGIRAPPTPIWKLDFVIWMYVWNTFLQGVLSGIMWGLNRYDRPSWATGFFVALACIAAAAGGIMVFIEGKKVKGIEGVPVSAEDLEKLRSDREAGVVHINNLSGKVPKEKKEKRSKTNKVPEGVDIQLQENAMETAVRDGITR